MPMMLLLLMMLALCAKFGAWTLYVFIVVVGCMKIIDMHYEELIRRL